MTEQLADIEHRTAAVDHVDNEQRIVTVIAVPWEQEAKIRYRDETWSEVFHRGALDELAHTRPGRVRANRNHEKDRVVGRAVSFDPGNARGCVAEVKLSKTLLGDETLELARDGVLSCSVGFGATGQRLDRAERVRHVDVAFLDHLAFVSNPAYEGAEVLGVRELDDPVRTPFAAVPNIYAVECAPWRLKTKLRLAR